MAAYHEILKPDRPSGTDAERWQQVYRYLWKLSEQLGNIINTLETAGVGDKESAKAGIAETVTKLKADKQALDALMKQVEELRRGLASVNGKLALNAKEIEANAQKIQLNAEQIALRATKEEVGAMGTRISSAEIRIDGLNAEIKLLATTSSIEALTSRVSQAEIDIDGANAQISLKASQKSVDALGERVSQAEINIDGANAQISLKASKQDLNEVSLRLDAAEGLIEAKAPLVRVEALETQIKGLVKVEDLESETLKVLESARISDLKAKAFNCSGTATMKALQTEGAVITNLNAPNIITQEIDLTGSMTINGETFAPDDYVKSTSLSGTLSNYATRAWVLERNYVSASDVSQTLDSYIMKGELEQKGTYVITSISTTSYDGYITGVSYNREWITYYA